MVTQLTKYKPISIPVDGSPPLLSPLVIARDDLTNQKAWDKLEDDKYYPFLEDYDFVDIELFEKYWFASLGLLEYPYLFITGEKRSGKSLFMNYLLHKITKYYGKRSTINWVAENPALISPYNEWISYDINKNNISDIESVEYKALEIISSFDKFTLRRLSELKRKLELHDDAITYELIKGLVSKGILKENTDDDIVPYHSLTDRDYVDKIQNEINDLANRLAVEKRKPTRTELEQLILFNAYFDIDEGSGIAGKGLGTNTIKLLGMIADRQAHLFLGMAISFVKPQDATGSLVVDNASHLISCTRNAYYRNACSYRIYSKRQGISKMLHLKPIEWTHLWDTHNLVAINLALNVKFGNDKAKENEKRRKLIQGG